MMVSAQVNKETIDLVISTLESASASDEIKDFITILANLSKNGPVALCKGEDYEELVDDQLWLTALESAGVDNWHGYEYACDEYHAMKGE